MSEHIPIVVFRRTNRVADVIAKLVVAHRKRTGHRVTMEVPRARPGGAIAPAVPDTATPGVDAFATPLSGFVVTV